MVKYLNLVFSSFLLILLYLFRFIDLHFFYLWQLFLVYQHFLFQLFPAHFARKTFPLPFPAGRSTVKVRHFKVPPGFCPPGGPGHPECTPD